jgi:hypothetical protein
MSATGLALLESAAGASIGLLAGLKVSPLE